jgi:hypothetical protein
LQLDGLPLKVLQPLGEGCFVTGGWDGHVHVLRQQPGGSWRASRLPTAGLKEGGSPLHAQQASSLIAAKMEQLKLAGSGSGSGTRAAEAAAAAAAAAAGGCRAASALHVALAPLRVAAAVRAWRLGSGALPLRKPLPLPLPLLLLLLTPPLL